MKLIFPSIITNNRHKLNNLLVANSLDYLTCVKKTKLFSRMFKTLFMSTFYTHYRKKNNCSF